MSRAECVRQSLYKLFTEKEIQLNETRKTSKCLYIGLVWVNAANLRVCA